ncbi:MAG: adenylate cyclase [Acidobacteria bacterium]|nr:MAG: adenylate cyclase [Acidobacteriota bacterium]RLE34137.1 MAG: adenylate cyclase [Acidobacteriota bacterium]
MPRNIEIKATVEDPAALQRRVEAIADQEQTELQQVDTFFQCSTGRLKLREFGDSPAELIYYQRSNKAGPKESSYFVAPVPDPGVMKQLLDAADGTLGVVKKRRLLYLIGQTRIHLDQVEGLGSFMELEVVLQDHQATDDGVVIAQDLMKRLDIREDQLVDTAYFDLLHGGI